MRSREEISADIKAEVDAQDALLKRMGAAYLNLQENLCKAHVILWDAHRSQQQYEFARHMVGLLLHDTETARLAYEKRREVLNRLFVESRKRREYDKAQKEAAP